MGLTPTDPVRYRLERLIETAVVGEAEDLRTVLTSDAEVWAPTVSDGDSPEADDPEPYSFVTVTDFLFERLGYSEPHAWAQWRLLARVDEPLLVADDILVEVSERPVTLVGATFAELRGERLTRIHTYFDDATLIEQIVYPR